METPRGAKRRLYTYVLFTRFIIHLAIARYSGSYNRDAWKKLLHFFIWTRSDTALHDIEKASSLSFLTCAHNSFADGLRIHHETIAVHVKRTISSLWSDALAYNNRCQPSSSVDRTSLRSRGLVLTIIWGSKGKTLSCTYIVKCQVK
jgi:hypothetical protein